MKKHTNPLGFLRFVTALAISTLAVSSSGRDSDGTDAGQFRVMCKSFAAILRIEPGSCCSGSEYLAFRGLSESPDRTLIPIDALSVGLSQLPDDCIRISDLYRIYSTERIRCANTNDDYARQSHIHQ